MAIDAVTGIGTAVNACRAFRIRRKAIITYGYDTCISCGITAVCLGIVNTRAVLRIRQTIRCAFLNLAISTDISFTCVRRTTDRSPRICCTHKACISTIHGSVFSVRRTNINLTLTITCNTPVSTIVRNTNKPKFYTTLSQLVFQTRCIFDIAKPQTTVRHRGTAFFAYGQFATSTARCAFTTRLFANIAIAAICTWCGSAPSAVGTADIRTSVVALLITFGTIRSAAHNFMLTKISVLILVNRRFSRLREIDNIPVSHIKGGDTFHHRFFPCETLVITPVIRCISNEIYISVGTNKLNFLFFTRVTLFIIFKFQITRRCINTIPQISFLSTADDIRRTGCDFFI